MSSTDNWIRLHQWWQEHLKSHDYFINRHPSLKSISLTKNSQLIKIKKRASYSVYGEHSISHHDFRHVRDSIRGKSARTTRNANYKRQQFRKSTTCDISSDEILPNENKLSSSSSSTNKILHKNSRKLSLVKFELPNTNAKEIKDEKKTIVPSTSHKLIQKLLFRQFNQKTRPSSTDISSEDDLPTTVVSNEISLPRRTSNVTSWMTNSKQNLRQEDDKLILSKSHQSDLNSCLSKRRNTTGSISLNKIVDLKNLSNGNNFKLNSTIINENIFQTVEESDFLATKQLIQTNQNIIHSYNEYDWCPLDIAIMLNNIPMIRLLLHYGANESVKIQPEEIRYQSICYQLSILSEQNSDELNKKASSNKLTSDDTQLRRLSPSCDKQQRHRRNNKNQQQLNQQRSLTLLQMKDNYEQAGKTHMMTTDI